MSRVSTVFLILRREGTAIVSWWRAKKVIFVFLSFSILLSVFFSAHAIWIGEGAVIGEVRSRDWVDGGMLFTLAIENQEINGPEVGEGNFFGFHGKEGRAIRISDRLRIHVNRGEGSKSTPIHVESVEILSDTEGDEAETPKNVATLLVMTTVNPGNTDYEIVCSWRSKSATATVQHAYNLPTGDNAFRGDFAVIYGVVDVDLPKDFDALHNPGSVIYQLVREGWTILKDEEVEKPVAHGFHLTVRTVWLNSPTKNIDGTPPIEVHESVNASPGLDLEEVLAVQAKVGMAVTTDRSEEPLALRHEGEDPSKGLE